MVAVEAQTSPGQQLVRAEIEGWGYDGTQATEQEVLHLLTALVLVSKPEVAVETGTHNGHGSKAISAGLQANDKGHLWTVENNPKIVRQLESVGLERATFVEADSVEWSGSSDCPEEIGFAFVDCCPDAEGRLKVFENLLPRITEGGLICAHDTEFLHYRGYLERLVEIAGPPYVNFPALNGIVVFQR